jgi:hypothetical protein
MPRVSERQEFMRELEWIVAFAIVDDDVELLQDAVHMYTLVDESRYFCERSIRDRQDTFFLQVFPNLSDGQFRSMFRTTRRGLHVLGTLIQQHPVFINNSTFKQAHPTWQLAIALYRFGHNGNGANVIDLSARFGIGAGTVSLYTSRVITALLSIMGDWIKWPDSSRRAHIWRAMREEGFPGCVGFLDGTTIPLCKKPAVSGNEYFDRKKRYTLH